MGKTVSTTLEPEGGGDRSYVNVLRPDIGERTNLQAATLIAIRDDASRFLMSKDEPGKATNLDPDAVKDARETYVAAGHQLRNLIDDMSRWTVQMDDIDRRIAKVLDLKADEAKANVTSAEAPAAPSVRLNAKIRQQVVGQHVLWVCWAGSDEPRQDGLYGAGLTPRDACAEFDVAFERQAFQPPADPTAVPPEPPSKAKPKKKGTK